MNYEEYKNDLCMSAKGFTHFKDFFLASGFVLFAYHIFSCDCTSKINKYLKRE